MRKHKPTHRYTEKNKCHININIYLLTIFIDNDLHLIIYRILTRYITRYKYNISYTKLKYFYNNTQKEFIKKTVRKYHDSMTK